MPRELSQVGASSDDGSSHTPMPLIDGTDRRYSKEEIERFVADIGRRVVDSNAAYMHSLLALNHILRQPNLPEVIDDELRDQMKDIWVKLMKSTGLQLVNPPILFGIADGLIQWDLDLSENLTRM